MTCARIAIVKTTWLLLETKITWQDRWLERERGHITNNVVRMITSCLTTAAGVNNLMSRYFQFIKFHVFWSSWHSWQQNEIASKAIFSSWPNLLRLAVKCCVREKTGSANWTLHNNPSVNHWEIDDWWLITDQGCITAYLPQEGQYWTLPLTRTRHPSPTTWAPWPRWHTGAWLWFCVDSWQNEAWVGGCSVLASLDST